MRGTCRQQATQTSREVEDWVGEVRLTVSVSCVLLELSFKFCSFTLAQQSPIRSLRAYQSPDADLQQLCHMAHGLLVTRNSHFLLW